MEIEIKLLCIIEHNGNVLFVEEFINGEKFFALPASPRVFKEPLRQTVKRHITNLFWGISISGISPAGFLEVIGTGEEGHTEYVYFSIFLRDDGKQIRCGGCTQLAWHPLNRLPNNIHPVHRICLEDYAGGINYRELQLAST